MPADRAERVEKLAAEMQPGDDPALQRSRSDLGQPDAAAGDLAFVVAGGRRPRQRVGDQRVDQPLSIRLRQGGRPRVEQIQFAQEAVNQPVGKLLAKDPPDRTRPRRQPLGKLLPFAMAPTGCLRPIAVSRIGSAISHRRLPDVRCITMFGKAIMIAGLLLTCSFAAVAGELTEALAWIPASLEDPIVAWTDWAALKDAAGVPWLTGRASLDVKAAFLRRIDEDHAAASAYALLHVAVHAEVWGFDTLDLEWEAQITAAGIPPMYLLKLSESADFEGFLGRLGERGFVQTASGVGSIFSRSIDPKLDWVRTTELAIHNTGIIEEERLLVLCSSLPVVELVLARHTSGVPALSEAEAVLSTLRPLGEPLSAILMIGGSTCLHFSPNPLLDRIEAPEEDSALDALRAWFESGEPLHGYAVLGVGYRHVDDRPVGTIAFAYPSAEDAAHDLEPRRLLAEHAASAQAEAPISEVLFTLEEAAVEDTLLRFEVRPVGDQPRRLFRMIWIADAPFAACR